MAKSEVLRQRLEIFINKYYQNLLIKGGIYTVSIGAMYFFLLALAEYLGRFGSTTRLILLIGLVAGLFGIMGYYIIYPLSKLLKLGKRISYEKAARIIGKHFPEVDDKLLNAIQLESLSVSQSELIQASIDQKIEKLSPVPFVRAIDFGENRKYWPILVIPILVFVGVALSGEWKDFTESGRRIAEFNKEFVPEAPFDFQLLTEDRVIEEGKSVSIRMSIVGEKIPSEASLVIGSEQMRMTREEGEFRLTIPVVESDFTIRFRALGFYSESYDFKVVPVPQLSNVVLKVIPPAYTQLKAESHELRTVHDIPEGSKVTWELGSKKVSRAWFVVDTVESVFKKLEEDQYRFTIYPRVDFTYAIDVANEAVKKRGLNGNRINVIKDRYPEVKVSYVRDTLEPNVVYYTGGANDDYGLSKVALVLENDAVTKEEEIPTKDVISETFGGVLSLDSLAGDYGNQVKVFMRVWDNDGVNGPKSVSSQPFVLELKGSDERKEDLSKGYQKYFESGESERKEREEIKSMLEEMKRSLLEKKSLSFKEMSKLKEILKKQEELLEQQRKNEELLKKLEREEEKLGLKREELAEQEESVKELSEKDKEIQELMKEVEELMEKLDTDKLKEKLDDLQRMNESNQRVEQRKDDILKDLRFKKDLLETADDLKRLSQEMEELAEMTGNEEDELNEQERIEEEFEKVSDKLDEMKMENQQFSKESSKNGMDEKQSEVEQQMDQAGDKLEDGDSKGANQKQKKAGEMMEEMSKGLQNTMMGMQAQTNSENIETLRQILENLETVSFGIEELSVRSGEIRRDDPDIKEILTEQKKLMLGTELIEDSLVALASRAPQVQQFVFDELDKMKYNLRHGIENLQELETGKASSHQQYVMTAANNLAVMLEQSLQNMMQMQAQMMPGQQQCQKPGSKPNGQTLKEMQSEMGKMMDRIKQGQKKGEGGKMSKEMVETISKQEQLRKALEEMQGEEGNSGSKGDRQKAIEELKKLQEDLMEGRIADNYKERLKEIETRLLESERAERRQKQDEKRESKSAESLKQMYSDELERYLKEKESESESLDRLPVEFKSYYKGQASRYLSVE